MPDAVTTSVASHRRILQALENAEKCNEDGVKLKMLQMLTSLLQNLKYCDSEDTIAQILGLCLRIHSSSSRKSSPAVFNTAAACIRQAVAVIFDHAVLPDAAENGSEVAALRLLADVCAMCAGQFQAAQG